MKIKSSKDKKQYVPHKLRSHPLRCISLPMFGLFLFIVFWFVLSPLVYVQLHSLYHKKWPAEWVYYFFTIAIIVFVILLALLICLWRFNPEKKTVREEECDGLIVQQPASKNSDFYTVNLTQEKIEEAILEENEVDDSDSCESLKSVADKNIQTEITDGSIEKMFSRCSIKRRCERKRPESVNLGRQRDPQKYRSLYVGPSSPLSPRELFFYDLIKNANRSDCNITQSFIENEKKACSQNLTGAKKVSDSSEYFIANIPSPMERISEVTLFVEGVASDKKLVFRPSSNNY